MDHPVEKAVDRKDKDELKRQKSLEKRKSLFCVSNLSDEIKNLNLISNLSEMEFSSVSEVVKLSSDFSEIRK